MFSTCTSATLQGKSIELQPTSIVFFIFYAASRNCMNDHVSLGTGSIVWKIIGRNLDIKAETALL